MEPLIIIISALIGALPSLLAFIWLGRKYLAETQKLKAETEKTEVDSAETITEAALKLLDPMKRRITELEQRVQELEEQVQKQDEFILKLLNGAAMLQHQVEETGEEPVFVIPIYERLRRKRKKKHASTASPSP